MSATLPAGNYVGKIQKVSLSKSKQKGTPQVVFACMLTGRIEKPGAEPTPVDLPYERSVIRYLTDGALDILTRDLEALGWNRDDLAELETAHPNHFPFEGTEVPLRMKVEKYEGKDQERWEFNFGGGQLGTPVERGDLTELNARFAGRLKGKNGAGAAPAAPLVGAGRSTEEQAEETF